MKSIIFSTPMVKAILRGRKTQMRQVIKPSTIEKGTNWHWNPNENIRLAPYQPGDILWVRETWAEVSSGIIEYKATYKEPYTGSAEIDHIGNKIKWRPSIRMPQEAARIFLRVKNIRVERLQEITEEDARAEGVNGIPRSTVLYPNDDYIYPFKQLWNSLNQKRSYGWDTNPWVWVIEFEKISKEDRND